MAIYTPTKANELKPPKPLYSQPHFTSRPRILLIRHSIDLGGKFKDFPWQESSPVVSSVFSLYNQRYYVSKKKECNRAQRLESIRKKENKYVWNCTEWNRLTRKFGRIK